MGIKVLVTGGLGVIGSLTVRRLLSEGHECVIFDNRAGDTSLIADLTDRVPVTAGDITDLAQVLDVIQAHKVDRIIHTAAIIDALDQLRPTNTVAVNVQGTLNVFEAARILGVPRVVFCSTRGVYEEISGPYGHPEYRPITEDYPKIGPSVGNTLYDATKQFCEHLAVQYRKRFGLDFVCLRFGSTFSPGKQARHGPLSIVSRMIENAVQGIPTHIPGGGDQKNDLVYNKDTAHALVLACFASDPQSRFYQIGSGVAASLRDVADAIHQVIPGAEITIGDGLDYTGRGKQSYSVFDITRARAELGYQPEFTLPEAVQDYIASLKQLAAAAGVQSTPERPTQ